MKWLSLVEQSANKQIIVSIEHAQLIRRLLSVLKRCIYLDFGLLNALIEADVISAEECKQICDEKTDEAKSERVLKWIMERCDEKQYNAFLNVLSENDQKHVVKYLQHNGGKIDLFYVYSCLSEYDMLRLLYFNSHSQAELFTSLREFVYSIIILIVQRYFQKLINCHHLTVPSLTTNINGLSIIREILLQI